MAAACGLRALVVVVLFFSAVAEDDVDCASMKTKALRKLLARKGQSCVGCAEKEDFVKMCEEWKDAPDVEPAPKPKETDEGKEKSIDDILASLKGMPGMENIKVHAHAGPRPGCTGLEADSVPTPRIRCAPWRPAGVPPRRP